MYFLITVPSIGRKSTSKSNFSVYLYSIGSQNSNRLKFNCNRQSLDKNISTSPPHNFDDKKELHPEDSV